MWLFSQHPDDLADSTIREFLGMRMVFRQQSLAAARAALQFLEADDDDLAHRLCESDVDTGSGFGSGTCLFRDLAGRVGLVQVHRSLHPVLRAAAETTPGATTGRAARHLRPVAGGTRT